MLSQRRRRWANIVLTLAKSLVFAGMPTGYNRFLDLTFDSLRNTRYFMIKRLSATTLVTGMLWLIFDAIEIWILSDIVRFHQLS